MVQEPRSHMVQVFKCDSTLTQLFVTLGGFKSELESCFYGYKAYIAMFLASPSRLLPQVFFCKTGFSYF